jgi:hypothetical protein
MAAEQTPIRIEWNKLLDEALTAPGHLGDVYSRFHDYSLTNMMLFLMQGIREPVASFKTWKSLGRHVVKGAKAKEVIVPVLVNEPAPEPSEDESFEEKRERIARLIGFKVVRAVFALSDTDGDYIPPPEPQGWNKTTALARLGAREVYFDQVNGNLQGWSRGTEFAINPMAVHPNKTLFHELGHIILGHTLAHHYEEYQAHRGIMEFQAEATAYLLMNELELMDDETASHIRGYIRHWLGEEHPPDQAIRQVFTTADRLLRAGRVAVAGAET